MRSMIFIIIHTVFFKYLAYTLLTIIPNYEPGMIPVCFYKFEKAILVSLFFTLFGYFECFRF